MILVDMDEITKMSNQLPDYFPVSQWVKDKEVEKLFEKLNLLSTHDLKNGKITPYCYDECCGCADCGEHEYTYKLDDKVRLLIQWNNWRNYTNSIEIQMLRTSNQYPNQEYWCSIFHMDNSLDVTSTKNGWLNEFDRKFLLHTNIQAILKLKEWKTRTDNAQKKLTEYQ